jgi:hypothetical protein
LIVFILSFFFFYSFSFSLFLYIIGPQQTKITGTTVTKTPTIETSQIKFTNVKTPTTLAIVPLKIHTKICKKKKKLTNNVIIFLKKITFLLVIL